MKQSRRDFIKKSAAFGIAGAANLSPLYKVLSQAVDRNKAERPNILWFIIEGINPTMLGCYGAKYADTPNLDRLASRSLRFSTCWSNAPVCAPARTALITGIYPTELGAEDMRTMVPMPSTMKMLPQLLRELGYYCTNNSKEDYNLETPGKVWDDSSQRAHWNNRPAGAKFFAVFDINTTHEHYFYVRPHTLKHDPSVVDLPTYVPDVPEVRHDWAQCYDCITVMDDQVQGRLEEIEHAGLSDDTIVFFSADHGPGFPRSKRFCYDSGLHVPLIVHVPEKFKHLAPKEYTPGALTNSLVSFVDFAPTVLSLAGGTPPSWMLGISFMGENQTSQELVYGFRGRMDERYDLVWSVRNERYIYIRNYMPHLIYGQHVRYMFLEPTTYVWNRLYEEDKLEPPQTFFWERKPMEEFYDLQSDPDEVHNLVNSQEHQEIIDHLRKSLRSHILNVRDLGFLPESEVYRRTDGYKSAPYYIGVSEDTYPLRKILSMAEMASSMKDEFTKNMVEGLSDRESAIRYWAIQGLIARGKTAVLNSRPKLTDLLGDESPAVSISAAWALGEFGDGEEIDRSLTALRKYCSPVDNGIPTAVEALNVVDALGRKASPLFIYLSQIPRIDPKQPRRLQPYVNSLLEHILSEPGSMEANR